MQYQGKNDISDCSRVAGVRSVDLGEGLSLGIQLFLALEAKSLTIGELFLEGLHGLLGAVVLVAQLGLILANLSLEFLVPVALVPNESDNTERHEAAGNDEANNKAPLVPAIVSLVLTVRALVSVEGNGVVLGSGVIDVVLVAKLATLQSGLSHSD